MCVSGCFTYICVCNCRCLRILCDTMYVFVCTILIIYKCLFINVFMSACVCVYLLIRQCVCAVGSLLLRVKPHCKLDSDLLATNSSIDKRPPAGI